LTLRSSHVQLSLAAVPSARANPVIEAIALLTGVHAVFCQPQSKLNFPGFTSTPRWSGLHRQNVHNPVAMPACRA
jgi:hypothetical protein